jgi:predicted ATPase/DNA-binding XRE family transcriptional regulator
VSFAELLKQLRRSAGLTQEALAERAGLSVNGISALERGTRTSPYPHTVLALADALALAPEQRARFLAEGTAGPAAEPKGGLFRPGLPVPPTTLVGRQAELGELLDRIADPSQRLITLTGPGGVGKTRLAVEAARRCADVFEGGVTFVDLAPVADPSLVRAVVLAGLGANSRPGRRLAVLDNFEHMLSEAAVVSELVAGGDVTVLVTSRARLRLRGEVEHAVAPLTLPRIGRGLTVDQVESSPAAQLFLQRARAVRPELRVTDANVADLAAICRRLGGLPLAVELAAAKSRMLEPAALLRHLDDALDTGWARDLPDRQHTLRSTLDWSLRLLDDDAQELLARLSVCAGGFTLNTALALAPEQSSWRDVLRPVEALVEHSLVAVVDEPPRPSYFRLLEPVRQYAAHLLAERGEEAAVWARHAEYFLSYAEEAAPEVQRRDRVRWLERTEWETDNFRIAMRRLLDSAEGERAARLAWALWQPWWNRGEYAEGQRSVEAVLALDLPPVWRGRALVVHASVCDAQGDRAQAQASWAEALELARAEGDSVGEAYGLAGLALVAMPTEPEAAVDLLDQAIPLADTVDEPWLHALCLIWRGALHTAAGSPRAARPLLEQALRSTRARRDQMITCVALVNLSQVALAEERVEEAEAHLAECIEITAGMGTLVNMEVGLALLAVASSAGERWRIAAVLLGAAGRMRDLLGSPIHDSYLLDQRLLDRTSGAVRAAMGHDDYLAAVARGSRMDLEGVARFVATEVVNPDVGKHDCPADS